jgi:hypothetical protein
MNPYLVLFISLFVCSTSLSRTPVQSDPRSLQLLSRAYECTELSKQNWKVYSGGNDNWRRVFIQRNKDLFLLNSWGEAYFTHSPDMSEVSAQLASVKEIVIVGQHFQNYRNQGAVVVFNPTNCKVKKFWPLN